VVDILGLAGGLRLMTPKQWGNKRVQDFYFWDKILPARNQRNNVLNFVNLGQKLPSFRKSLKLSAPFCHSIRKDNYTPTK